MEKEKSNESQERKNVETCPKCKNALNEKYGIYYCTTLGCEGSFMVHLTREIAHETLKRVRGKHAEYSESEDQLPHVLNDPYYESFLDASTKFHTIALFIEKDLNAAHHSTDCRTATYYFEFFQAAEHFEKMLDDWKTNKEESL